MVKIKFRKSKIHIKEKYIELNDIIVKLLETNEEIIFNYIERIIYTSIISNLTKSEIDKIYLDIRNMIH